MATAYISTNTEISLVNTLNQSLTLFLPSNTPNGRNLFVKDAAGNCGNSTIVLRVQGSDIFEDGSVFQTLNSAYESMQYMYNSNIWYFNGGTMLNTYRVSTLNTLTTQAQNLSTGTISVSTLQINDVPRSTVGTFNTVSSFLLYNGFNIGGGLRTAIPQSLNITRFSIYSIPGLAGWYDAADTTTINFSSGSNIVRWTDKSGSGNNAIQIIAGNQPQYNSGIRGIVFNGTTQYMLIPANGRVQFNPINMYAVINTPTITGGYFNNVLRKGANGVGTFEFYLRVIVQSGTPTVNSQIGGLNSTVLAGTTTSLTDTSYTFNSLQLVGLFTNQSQGYVMTNGTAGSVTTLSVPQQFAPAVTGVGCRPITSDGSSVNEYFNGNMYEIIVFNVTPTVFQRQQVEGYLAWKWGLQANLPASHPFRNAPPQ